MVWIQVQIIINCDWALNLFLGMNLTRAHTGITKSVGRHFKNHRFPPVILTWDPACQMPRVF